MKLDELKAALTMERVLCRLVAAWLSFAALIAMKALGFWEIEYISDPGLLSGCVGIGALFLLYTAVAVWVKSYPTDSWFLLLGAAACSGRWILTYDAEQDRRFLMTLAIIAVDALVVAYFIRQNGEWLQKWQPGNRTLVIFTAVCAVTACTVISIIGCLRYKTFSTPNYDFGLFCNMFHNMRETGLPLATSERDKLLSHFAVHISPIYYLLLPFYWIFPSPMTLQIGQAVLVCLGVIPAVLLAKHFRLSGKACMLVALIYCFYPVLSGGCFYDIHENCFLPLCLLLTFYFFEKEKYPLMYLSALAVLAVKEDAAIYLLIFAVYVFLSRRKYAHGTILAVASLTYFLLATYLINTVGDGVLSNRFSNLIADEESGLGGIIGLALYNPGYLLTQIFTTAKGGWEKIYYFLMMLLPLGLIPFFTKKASRWLLIAPILINLLSYYTYLYDPGFQYHFGVIAFLIYATVQNLGDLQAPTRRQLLGFAATACCCLYLFLVVPKMNTYVDRWKDHKQTYIRMEEILDQLPEDASLNVSSFLLAHVSDRAEVYEVAYHGDAADVDFVVLDKRYSSYEKTALAYEKQGYTVYADYDNLILILQKGEGA